MGKTLKIKNTHRRKSRKKKLTKRKRVKRNKRRTFKVKQRGGGPKPTAASNREAERERERKEKEEAATEAERLRVANLTPEELAAEEAAKAAADEEAKADAIKEGKNTKANYLLRNFNNTGSRNQYQMQLIDLGKMQEDSILNFNYKTFDNISGNITHLNLNSEKYSFYSFTYLKDDKISPVMLKLPKDPRIFILYEYIAGQYVNTLCKQYPCFLETYNYIVNNLKSDNKIVPIKNGDPYYFPDKGDYEENVQQLLKDSFISGNEPAYQYTEACERPTDIAILIQYLPNATTTRKFITDINNCVLDKKNKKDFTNCISNKTFEMMCFLFQIYIPLAELKDTFSHNNLTLDQILCYTPFPKETFTFNYIFDAKTTIIFHTDYIVKIKNYEKCYFKRDDTFNSDKISQEMSEKGCTFTKPENENLKTIKPGSVIDVLMKDPQPLGKELNKLFIKAKNIIEIAAIIKQYMVNNPVGELSRSLGIFTVYMDGSGKSMTYQHKGAIKS